MHSSLTVVRYPKWLGWAGFLSMAIFRLPLMFSKKHAFWKLMGCGRNGSFDIIPDWRQWALLEIPVTSDATPGTWHQTPKFFFNWWSFFRCEKWTVDLEPIEGHGTWDGKQVFGDLPKQTSFDGMIAVLTRATIRMRKLNSFWKNVGAVSSRMAGAEGFICSVGIGEVPWIKQATFSIWESKAAMKQFAYSMQEHAEVIRKTRKEDWYSEEMFVRFIIVGSRGSLHGKNPLAGKL